MIMKKTMETVLRAAVYFIPFLFALFAVGCSGSGNVSVMPTMQHNADLEPKEHNVIVAETHTVDKYMDVSAIVSYDDTVDLSFKIDNCNFKAVYVEANQSVEKGQLLAELDASDLEYQVASRQVDLKRAQLRYDMLSNESGLDAADLNAELESLKLDIASINLDIAYLQKTISKTQITAPFSGVITYAKSVPPGTTVLAYDKYITIWQSDSIKLVSDILNPSGTSGKIDLSGITKGMKVILIYGSMDTRTEIPATITKIVNTDPGVLNDPNRILASSPAFQIYIKPEGPDVDKLFLDRSVTLRINTGKLENAVVLPESAVRSYGQDRIVKVIKGDKTITRLVTIGYENKAEDIVVITNGLRPGENILAD
jgi:macrolide-specific efflux system membrane fusion protein